MSVPFEYCVVDNRNTPKQIQEDHGLRYPASDSSTQFRALWRSSVSVRVWAGCVCVWAGCACVWGGVVSVRVQQRAL